MCAAGESEGEGLEAAMILSKYITKTSILPEVEGKVKGDVLRELAHLLADKKRIPEVGPAVDQIMAREMTESTGIGAGIAVPHARVAGLKGLVCAVGRTPKGLDFDAIDRKPVQLIFLICYPPVEQTTYLNFIATIARIVRDPANKKALLEAESAEEMLAILEETSKAFSDNHEDALRKVQADPDVEQVPDAHADLILLARLQLWQESLANARTGKKEIQKRIDAIRSLVSPRVLKHFDRLSKACPPALVAVEGDTCQGCFMRLHSKFVQEVRQDTTHIHTCTNCSRYIYVV